MNDTTGDVIAETLAAASIDKLLTTAFALTHRMHATESDKVDDWRTRLDSLRTQRDMIVAEIKRRCES